MSYPRSEMDRLPPWKLRLLERLQNTAATHARVLREGFPVADRGNEASAVPVLVWRAHLRALETERAEIETHARGTGIGPEAVAWARAAGARGERWGELVTVPPTSGHREDPVRGFMVEGIANDIWQLEHTAAVIAEYRHRAGQGLLPEDPDTYQRLQRNMLAVWERADATAHTVGLSEAEAAQIWDRDRTGWRQLIALTVRDYDNAELLERWQAYSWRGIALDAHQSTANLAVRTPHHERPTSPPVVARMIQNATEAVQAPDLDSGRASTLDRAVHAAIPAEHVPGWDLESDTDAGPGAAPASRAPGTDPGYDR